MMVSKSKKICAFASCGLFGIVSLVVGVVLIHVFSDLIRSEVDSNIPLVNGSDAYNSWQKPTTPKYTQFWTFNIVNPEEVNNGEKPMVEEKGPYTYREYTEKFDISYDDDNGTVFYRERKTMVFEPKMSVGTENDTFITVNLPMLTVLNRYRNKSWEMKLIIEGLMAFTGETLFTNVSLYHLLWGYTDPFLHEVNKILKNFNETLPEFFGLFAGTNGTDDGLYQIHSGIKNLSHFGEVVTWNGMESLPYWTSDIANGINGSDGTLYPPYFDKHATKYLFSTSLCRSINMDYSGSTTVRDIEMCHYEVPPMEFANATVNENNAGFCTPAGNCLPSGLLNISVCKDGAPVMMSMPHFLYGDPELVKAIEGLHPNKKAHYSFIDIEPMTGLTMNAAKRTQINAFFEKIDGFIITDSLNSTFMPMIWMNESGIITEHDASEFRSKLTNKVTMTKVIQYCLIGLGGFVLLALLAILVKVNLIDPKRANILPAINTDDDEPLIFNTSASATHT